MTLPTDRSAIKREIEARLAARKNKVVNRNAMSALFGAFSDPVGALGKIFLGRDEALDSEKQKIVQELTLDLLCKFDEAITQTEAQGISLAGLIETSAQNVESVIGVHIAGDSGPVVFQPGTHIKTEVTGAKRAVGLQIGGKKE